MFGQVQFAILKKSEKLGQTDCLGVICNHGPSSAIIIQFGNALNNFFVSENSMDYVHVGTPQHHL